MASPQVASLSPWCFDLQLELVLSLSLIKLQSLQSRSDSVFALCNVRTCHFGPTYNAQLFLVSSTIDVSSIMSLLRGSKKLIVGLSLAGCGATAAFLFGFSNDPLSTVKAASLLPDSLSSQFTSFGNRIPLATGVKWDANWDKREPEFLVKPLKGKFGPQFPQPNSDAAYNERLEKAKAVATRHLILIRHGQYNLQGKEDRERYLTDLGREQAKFAGLRLKELGLPYTRLVQSTMTRAQETAQIISKELPSDLKIESCDFLREGAPVEPDPPTSWRPEARVSYSFHCCIHSFTRGKNKTN